MFYATLKTLHVLSIIVWIGGMVFAHFFLRPAVAQLEPAVRLRLMLDVLGRFFRAVLAASLLTLATGVWMLGRVALRSLQAVQPPRCGCRVDHRRCSPRADPPLGLDQSWPWCICVACDAAALDELTQSPQKLGDRSSAGLKVR